MTSFSVSRKLSQESMTRSDCPNYTCTRVTKCTRQTLKQLQPKIIMEFKCKIKYF